MFDSSLRLKRGFSLTKTDKIVGTTEAGFLLNISVSRVRVLLQQNRIKGATKEGRVWKIPLYNGMPKVEERGSGLKGTWRKKACNKATVVHVHKPQIDRNRKHKTNQPVITIRQGSRKTYCHMVEIKGACRVVYQPDNPLPCGAVVWIEVVPDTVVIPQLLKPKQIAIARSQNQNAILTRLDAKIALHGRACLS